MRLKPLITALCLGIATLSLAISCGSAPSTPPSAEADNSSDGRLRVAMISNVPEDDDSWGQAGYEGLKLVEQEFNAEVSFRGMVPDDEGADVLREYAEAGYDFIIAHSGGYIESAEAAAADFPRSKFAIITTYGGNNSNLGAVAFRSEEVGYLSGVLAAMTTETNKVAYLAGYDYPVYQEEAATFEKGAKATNPDVEVVTEFLQTWNDEAIGRDAVLALAEQGFDRFALNADDAGLAGIRAIAADENYRDVKVIGWTKDQHSIAPDHVITSVLQDIPRMILNAVDLLQQGRWEGKLYKFGLREEIYDFAPFRGSISAQQEAQFEQIKNQVMLGEIDLTP